MFERLRTGLAPWLTWFSTLSLPARFLIGATVSAIGSAGAVGAVTKLGAYWFVLYYGVRTPADGIPYVAETAAALSVLILVSAALVYLAAYLLLSVLKLGTSAKAGDPDFIHTLGHLYIWCMRIGAILVLVNIIYVLAAFPWSEFANRLGHKAALYGLIFLLGNLSISFGVWKGAAVFALLTVFSVCPLDSSDLRLVPQNNRSRRWTVLHRLPRRRSAAGESERISGRQDGNRSIDV